MRTIWCENSLERMWGLFLYFESEPIAKDYLFQSYLQVVNEKDATRLAFDNTHKFIYFLKQGVSYFKSAQASELIVRPLLLYYGFTSLMKAIILSKDPYYPRTTTVLQHGITTRKRKKNNYVFHEDEIKVQKNGLLPHFGEVVLQSPLEIHSKYKIIDLLGIIPELQESYQLMFAKKTMLQINWDDLQSKHIFTYKNLKLPLSSPEVSQIIHVIQSYGIQKECIHFTEQDFTITIDPLYADTKYRFLDQLVTDYKGNRYFYYHQKIVMTDEIITYNMVMYILGMLCRYDTELWGELLFTFSSSDMYIIEEFLQLSMRKFPNLILNHLFGDNLVFET